MSWRRRLWLLAPAVALYAGDVGLTLAGQPAAYWAGVYGEAVEANPVAHPLLVRSPWLFVAFASCWLAVLSGIIACGPPQVAGWVAVVVAAAHAIGGGSWLVRAGPWGLVAAGAYIVAAAQVSSWCWRRYGCGDGPAA
jgi:hypothetical protein